MQAGDTALARRYAALVLAKRKLRETTLGHIMRVESMVRPSQVLRNFARLSSADLLPSSPPPPPRRPIPQMSTMQQAAMNKDLVDNMRAANEQINALLARMQDAEEIVAESADCIARVDRLSEVLQAPLYGTQESAREVEAELARLMPAAAAGAAAAAPAAAASSLPAPVPAYIPEVPAAAARSTRAAAAAAVPA